MADNNDMGAAGIAPPRQEQQNNRRNDCASSSDNNKRAPLRVLFLSADTGGGHRASAESLGKQFQIHFPGSTFDLLDIWSEDGCFPYKSHVSHYKHLSAHPNQWRLLYYTTNTPLSVYLGHRHSTYFCERRIRNHLLSYDPDVIVSVHPTMVFTPAICLKNIARDHGKHIPFFTVCTDLGAAHATWFSKNVDKLFVASDRLYRLAKQRSGISESKLVLAGLPIRHDFSVRAQQMGADRNSPAAKAYQRDMRKQLHLAPDRRMILLMGGGEGVGSLSKITAAIFKTLSQRNMTATICVVCGRNDTLRNELLRKNWNALLDNTAATAAAEEKREEEDSDEEYDEAVEKEQHADSKVQVVPLGFLTNMADYMVAADVLITKAGPGSIAEAAALGLPVLLTSYLPGQEAGNVDFVLEQGFGAYHKNPKAIASEVAKWLENPEQILQKLSEKARAAGNPNAAADIVLDIGTTTLARKQTAVTNSDGTLQEQQPQRICGVSLLDYWVTPIKSPTKSKFEEFEGVSDKDLVA